MNHRAIYSVLLMLALFGCSKEPSGAEYFGDSSAERRTYDMKMLVPLTGEVKGIMISSNRGKETIGGKEYFKIVTTMEGIPGAQPETSYSRLGEDGIYSRKSTDPGGLESLEVPLPPTVGRKWSFKQGDMDMEMQIVAIEDFDTSERTYKRCLKIVGSGKKGADQIEATSYHAPNVGLVLMSMKASGVSVEVKLRQ